MGAGHVVLKLPAASTWLGCEPSLQRAGVFSAGVSLYPGRDKGGWCDAVKGQVCLGEGPGQPGKSQFHLQP